MGANPNEVDFINSGDVPDPKGVAFISQDEEHDPDAVERACIERLRASKRKHYADLAAAGKGAGREWAAQQADFVELNGIAKLDVRAIRGTDYVYQSLKDAVDPDDNMTMHDVMQYLFGDYADQDDEYTLGFVEGAQEFFESVKGKL